MWGWKNAGLFIHQIQWTKLFSNKFRWKQGPPIHGNSELEKFDWKKVAVSIIEELCRLKRLEYAYVQPSLINKWLDPRWILSWPEKDKLASRFFEIYDQTAIAMGYSHPTETLVKVLLPKRSSSSWYEERYIWAYKKRISEQNPPE